ncbi:MAG: FRG domain-containing protein [Lachnospiraceae bacterium]|nr:FRG domain-containing protein [Lachnospiraceae bacterium]
MEEKLDVIHLDDVDIRDMQDDFAFIDPMIKYMYIVQKIDRISVKDDSEKNSILYFRGQSKKDWKIVPSVFRDAQLGQEHELIREAIRRKPDELANGLTNFERLTKLQHYELPTRLLDVTENPLIALYFACEIEPEEDGAVYMTHTYPTHAGALEAQILSYIAHLDLKGMTLRQLWLGMQKEGIDLPPVQEEVAEDFLDNYINLIKRNYFIRANLDNSRIRQQSGAFLLSGCIRTLVQENKWDSVLEKTDKCLETEFTHKIIIPHELKEELLGSLDLCNINEATVYPELDHQMRYIRQKVKRMHISAVPVGEDSDAVQNNETPSEKHLNRQVYQKAQDQLSMEELWEIVTSRLTNNELSEEVCRIFAANAKLDWPIRKQLQANITRNITRYLVQQRYDTLEGCSKVAKLILEDGLAKISE